MSAENKMLKNRLGLLGWVSAGRYGLERYAYTLHRLTGLGILLYFILHIFVTGSRLGGTQSWADAMQRFENPYFKFGEFLLFLAFAFHALNGIRLIITELGIMIGKPERPLFPYVTSLHKQRPLFIIVMIVAAILMILGGADFYLI